MCPPSTTPPIHPTPLQSSSFQQQPYLPTTATFSSISINDAAKNKRNTSIPVMTVAPMTKNPKAVLPDDVVIWFKVSFVDTGEINYCSLNLLF